MPPFEVSQLDSLKKLLNDKDKENAIILFLGSLTDDGKSWCPDCVACLPVINKCYEELKDSFNKIIIYAYVGNKQEWKASENPFKMHFKLKYIPTLLKYNEDKRLEENECMKYDTVKKFLME